MAKLCEDKGETLITESEKLFYLDLKNLSNDNLIKVLTRIVKLNRDFTAFVVIVLSLEPYFEKVVASLKKKVSEKFHEYLETSEKLNESQKEAKRMLELAVLDKVDLEQGIKSYIDNYGWIQVKYFIGNFPNKNDIKDRLNEIKNPNKSLEEIEQNNRNNQKIK